MSASANLSANVFGNSSLLDDFGRTFNYLRLSVTDQCNFRCLYCLPNGYQAGPEGFDYLTTDEILRLARGFVGLGVKKIRLTGGEPTLRKDLCQIVSSMRALSGIQKVALSTNGHDLDRRARDYLSAGVTNLNVSLDDVDPEEFARIRGRDVGTKVLCGIERALAIGFPWIKVNTVLMKDSCDERFERFSHWVKDKNVSVRFIELMPTSGREEFHKTNHVSASVLHQWLIGRGWKPQVRPADAGPAVEYSHKDSVGKMGIIAPYAKGFCDSCNRLRVSSRGELKLCLYGTERVSLRDLLQGDDDTAALQMRIVQSLRVKNDAHRLHQQDTGSNATFSSIGG